MSDIKELHGKRGEEPLTAKLQLLSESTLPDEQRLQVLIALCTDLSRMIYYEMRRHAA
jgi:hypothetical protein